MKCYYFYDHYLFLFNGHFIIDIILFLLYIKPIIDSYLFYFTYFGQDLIATIGLWI